MTTYLAIALGIAAALLAYLIPTIWRMQGKYRQTGLLFPWPIKKVKPEQIDPIFAKGPLGSSRDTEVAFIGDEGGRWTPSDRETWIMCALAKRARCIFEFGTCSGRTTYLFARNAPADATVATLTLKPEQTTEYHNESGDATADRKAALAESAFTSFFYTGTEVEPKIRQIYGDSKTFDESEYAGKCDLIFIDGSHAYSYVHSDSKKALRMIRPGGFIFWHDYRGPRSAVGVYRALNEMAKTMPLRHIARTSLVFYHAPDNGAKPE